MTKSKLAFILMTALTAKLVQEHISHYRDMNWVIRQAELNHERYAAAITQFNAVVQHLPLPQRINAVAEMIKHDKFLTDLYDA